MKRLPLIAVAVVGLSPLIPVPVAVADPNDCYDIPNNLNLYNVQGFYDSLESHGVRSEESPELRTASLEMGCAICNAYATTQSNEQVGQMMFNIGDTARDAATWTVASVEYLCPQYQYLLGT